MLQQPQSIDYDGAMQRLHKTRSPSNLNVILLIPKDISATPRWYLGDSGSSGIPIEQCCSDSGSCLSGNPERLCWQRTRETSFRRPRVEVTSGNDEPWRSLLHFHQLKYFALIDLVFKMNSRFIFVVIGTGFHSRSICG